MNERPKIASLSEKELAALLVESFHKIGKVLRLSNDGTKKFLDHIYKHHGGVYTDDFQEAFSMYAACVLPGSETLRPQASQLFVGQLLKVYATRNAEKNPSNKNTSALLTPEEKYVLFLQFIKVNKCVPANSDWVTLYEYLCKLNKLELPVNWASLSFFRRWKSAEQEVTNWAYNHFTINEQLFKSYAFPSPLKGIGTRLGETL